MLYPEARYWLRRDCLGDFMKKYIALLVVAALGFYVAWPAWSAYRIATALSQEDEAALASKVDFIQVRESLRPTAVALIGKQMDKQSGALGSLGQVLGGDLKAQMLGKVADQVLALVVTPGAAIRIARDGGDVAGAFEKAMRKAAPAAVPSTGDGNAASGGLGGVFGQAAAAVGVARSSGIGATTPDVTAPVTAQPAATAPSASANPAAKRAFGLGNVKGLSLAGPLGFDIAVARDVAQSKPDATIGMAFTGGDWKLTRVVPNM